MTFGIDIYDRYQDITDARALRDSPFDFAYVKLTDGNGKAPVPGDDLVRILLSIGVPTGGYHYAELSPSPEKQAEILAAEVRRLGATGLPPALDLEDPYPAVFATQDFAKRFLVRLTTMGFPVVTLYANTSMLNAIRAWELHDVVRRAGGRLEIWAANYGNNDGVYTQADAARLSAAYPHPVKIHQYSSTIYVPGIPGHVDGNWMFGTPPNGEDDMTPDEFLKTEVKWYDGEKATVNTILTELYIAARGLRGVPAFDDQTDVVQLPPLVSISAAVEGLSDDESRVIAEMRSNNLVLLTAIGQVDGQPSDEQVAALAQMLGEQLGGEYTVTIQRNDTPGNTPA